MPGTTRRWSETELLAEVPALEPLVVDGRRCHGGIDADGRYHSPRSRFRNVAIASWQEQHHRDFGTALFDVGLDAWPRPFPNVAQSRHLLQHGVRGPVMAALTRIGTVEGFGGAMRAWPVADLQAHFVEPIRDTTLDHLPAMFEAQARDEAGWGDELGHRDMWFLARDIAFEHPSVEDLTELMLFRLGVTSAPGAPLPSAEEARRRQEAQRVFPTLPLDVEALIQRMVNLLLVEISAAHLFAWAEELLADRDLVAGEGVGADLVRAIRQDESPHVEYLRTALSEMRDRTFLGEDGMPLAGDVVVNELWRRGLADSTGARRERNVRLARAELADAVARRRDRAAIVETYEALAHSA
ncbi:MAG: hypothetical protein ACXVLO_10620 [Acidimicrobiia bacterium]